MFLSPDVVSTLEFNKLKKEISLFSFSIFGREGLISISPDINKKERDISTRVISTFREILNITEPFPIPGGEDIRPILKKVAGGIYHLSSEELIFVSRLTEEYKTLGRFLKKFSHKFEYLLTMALPLLRLPDIFVETRKVFDENGNIKDNATKELKRVRQGFTEAHKELTNAANKLVKEKQRFLQEDNFTVKGGRVVLPVVFSEKKNIPGIVHSISQTQNTVFIEPFDLVEFNNKCATMRLREEAEIKRILSNLTEIVREHINYYQEAVEKIKEIDTYYAIASFSEQEGFSAPVFSEKTYLSIRGGFHPLLSLSLGKTNVVPFDIKLGDLNRILLVSGPNMGGKTVLLKSIGLIVLMAYAGMHIPAENDSVIPRIDSIYVDIGDEQSIERNLSTFSSHMGNITRALKYATDNSLVLLDEIGVGTDPEEGMAIAMVTLKRLAEIGALGFVTTHYGRLKHFVAGEKGMENGSMDFDTDRGQPTHHLTVGIPGASHGLEVAKKVGFPDDLLEMARSYMDKNEIETDKMIHKLGRMIKEQEEMIKKVKEEKENLAALLSLYDEKYSEIKNKEETFIKEAKQKALEVVYSTRKEMERIVREIRESKGAKEVIKEARRKIEERLEKKSEPKISYNFSIGDIVYSEKLRIKGKVIEVFKEYVKIESDNVRFFVPKETLRLIKDDKENQPSEDKIHTLDIGSSDDKLDIRGFFAEEAEARVIKFIDNAVLFGFSTVFIIHGKGNGILRDVVSTLLKKDERVENFRLGYASEGGSGVTVVKLKS